MMPQRPQPRPQINWRRFAIVFCGMWAFMYLVVYPILALASPSHTVPTWLWFTVSVAIAWIVIRETRSWFTKEQNDE